MFEEVASVRREASHGGNSAVGLLLRTGGMLREEPGDMVIENYRFVYERSERAREKPAAGAAATYAHLVVDCAVDHRMLSHLQLKRTSAVDRESHLLLVAELRHSLYDEHPVGALYFIHSA